MKKVSTALLASVLVLAGCSGGNNGGSSSGGEAPAEQKDAKELYGCNVINVYNWGEYIGEDVITNFESEYNATVNYQMFESNEMMYTSLLGGNAYDVLVPSDYTIERLIKENRLQELDTESMENLGQISPQLREMQKVYDPDLKYAVPYFWGTVGLVYDTTKVDPADIEAQGWDILHDTRYKGDIFVYDSERDAFMVAFKALGYSMNTENEAEIQEAYQWLRQINDTMEPSYVTDEIIDAMVNGEKAIGMIYSGDAAYVIAQNENMAYIEPYQGTNLWSDAMVIPANAGCPGLANAFIDYSASYDVAYANSEEVGYSSANTQVLEDLSSDDGEYAGIDAYLPRQGFEKDEVFRYNEVLKQELSELWTRVKA